VNRNEFPREFAKLLVLRQTNRSHLAKAMERRGYRLSKQFLSQIANGIRSVPAVQLERIADTLALTSDEKITLSRAACRDQGYDV